MPYDFKKAFKEQYAPKTSPAILTVPPINFVAIEGRGDPNEEDGAYQRALAVLYAVSYTLKKSPQAGREIPGFFDYVVPPLEAFLREKGCVRDVGQKRPHHEIYLSDPRRTPPEKGRTVLRQPVRAGR